MSEKTGICQIHKVEFILAEGCPLCLAEKKGKMKGKLILDGGVVAEVTEVPDTVIIARAGGDSEVINYYSQAVKLKVYAESREIKTADDMKVANDDMTIISRLKKALEAKRKDALQPLQDKVKEVRGNFDFLLEPILAADRITREKMMTYNQEQLRRQREQEEINKKRMEAAEAEMKLNGELSESVNLVEVTEAPKRVSTEMGTSGMVDNWKYEIVDLDALPREYLVPDTAMLNSIAKKHHDTKQIPGVRFYNEPTLRVTAK